MPKLGLMVENMNARDYVSQAQGREIWGSTASGCRRTMPFREPSVLVPYRGYASASFRGWIP